MNINGRSTIRSGNINGRPGTGTAFNLSSTDAKSAPMLGANTTTPREIWASVSDYLVADNGPSQTTDQFFATRQKARIQGGRWKALAPVFVGSYVSSLNSPVGTQITAPYTVSWALNLSNGTQPSGYTFLNAGGVTVAGKFNGTADGIVRPGDIVVGDFLYASDFSLTSFNFTDRALLPWIQCAFSKTAAADNIGSNIGNLEYNAPMNYHYATCTTYASAKTLISASPPDVAGGNDHWGVGDTDNAPSCIGFIGIPMDGQKATMIWGTSINDGNGNSLYFRQGGVNPTNNSMANYDFLGTTAQWAQNLSNQVPLLKWAVGGSAASSVWSDVPADYAWSTDLSISTQRMQMATIARWFDLLIIPDVHNDATATYAATMKKYVNWIRGVNPLAVILGCRQPNGYVDISGATVAYSAALDARWTIQDNLATSGYINGVITLRQGGNIYPDLGTQVTSTTTSLGTTTTLNDSGQTWLTNQWAGSWVSVGGVAKLIASNTRTQLTFGAYGVAVASGTAYLILGNTTQDGIHPNTFAQKGFLSTNFKSQIASYISIPYFTRTA